MRARQTLVFLTVAVSIALGCGGNNDPTTDASQSDNDGQSNVSANNSDNNTGSENNTDNNTAPENSTNSGPVDTSGVYCDFGDEGDQRLVYSLFDPRTGARSDVDETLTYSYAWSCTNGNRTVTGNGVPNHTVAGGEFATMVSTQDVSMTLTLEPEVTAQITAVKEPGLALNSIKFDPGTAGTCPDDATVDTECDYGAGSDQWHMVATAGDVSPWRFGFGVDENDAHVQPTGQYHYHGDPVRLVEALNPDHGTSMTLIGWANDGFPIYSRVGHSDPDDLDSEVVAMQSSYKTISEVPADRPSVEDFPLGHFESDWEYVEGSGDLDECNGRFAVTPEFPDGIYHYYTTGTYPFVQRCVKGTGAAGAGGAGGPPPGGM